MYVYSLFFSPLDAFIPLFDAFIPLFDTFVSFSFDATPWLLLNEDDLDRERDEGMLTDWSMIGEGLIELMTDSFNRENISDISL